MKTLILYYSFQGSTEKEAKRLAAETGADLCRIREKKDRSMTGAFLTGPWQAIFRRAVPIRTPAARPENYDRLIIGCPVWAGYPAPAFNSILKLLPPGKATEVFFCSATGNAMKSEKGTRALLEKRGCKVTELRIVATGTMKQPS